MNALSVERGSLAISLVIVLVVSLFVGFAFSANQASLANLGIFSSTHANSITSKSNSTSSTTQVVTNQQAIVSTTQANLTTSKVTVSVNKETNCTNISSSLGPLLAKQESDPYLFIGGQNGTWFTPYQFPMLSEISLTTYNEIPISVLNSTGAVWGGGWNGSSWLISGYGACTGPESSNPFVLSLGPNATKSFDSLGNQGLEWKGGDIFATSPNGSDWLVSGMGSGYLQPNHPSPRYKVFYPYPYNHLSLGLFKNGIFVDYSSQIPVRMDGILYANAFNGTNWLVGGGYKAAGVLYSFDGQHIVDLSKAIQGSVKSFHSVQSISWNGKDWLIGGVGFLAIYDGVHFYDLTSQLNETMQGGLQGLNAVNSISWNGSAWLIAGGAPVSIVADQSQAWFAVLDNETSVTSRSFINLTPLLDLPSSRSSSILSTSFQGNMIFLGGYSEGNALLLSYDGRINNMSFLAKGMTYVNWLEAVR